MQKSDFNLHLYLVGDYGIGKRSLMKNLLAESDGIQCTDKYNGDTFKLILQCAQKLSEVPVDAFGIIMVYDLTHRTTFATIQRVSSELEKTQNWPLRAIVGTFRDQQDQAQVDREEATAIKQTHGCLCFEVSNVTGENVITLQKQLAIRATFTYRQRKLSGEPVVVPASAGQGVKSDGVTQLKMYVVGMPGSGRRSFVQSVVGQKRWWVIQDGREQRLCVLPVVVETLVEVPPSGVFAIAVIYDITNPRSFEYARELAGGVAKRESIRINLLIGTHRDGPRAVSIPQGQEIKQAMRAFFMEISSRTLENVAACRRQAEIRIAQAYWAGLEAHPETHSRPSATRQDQLMSGFTAGPRVQQYPARQAENVPKTTLDPAALDTRDFSSTAISGSVLSPQTAPVTRQAFEQKLEQQKKEMQEILEMAVTTAQSVYDEQPLYQQQQTERVGEELDHLKSIGTRQQDEILYQQISAVQFKTLKARPSRMCTKLVPELTLKPQETPQQPAGPFLMNPAEFASKLIGLQPTRAQIVMDRKAQKLAQHRVQVSFAAGKSTSEKLLDPDPVVVIEFEAGQKLLELRVKEDDNPYEIAKKFVSANNLDITMVRQITMLIIERLEAHHEKRKNEYLENKRMQHQERISMLEQSVPRFKHLEDSRAKKAVKPLFKFELFVGTKGSTIAVRPGDDPRELAERFCNLMTLNKAQYFGFVVAKIQESLALYQLQREGHAVE